jgi:enamine deaminase RidA (YjgF/YER057c/UK114 family)
MSIAQRLAELGITLPTPAAPAGSYVPFVLSGKQLFIAGQLPFADGKLTATGIVGRDVTVEQANAAARDCGINILAQVQAALGDLERVSRVIKLGAFVASTPDFTEQPKVANGCSDFLVAVMGDRGRHARSAVGAPSLPLNASVEIDAIFEVA